MFSVLLRADLTASTHQLLAESTGVRVLENDGTRARGVLELETGGDVDWEAAHTEDGWTIWVPPGGGFEDNAVVVALEHGAIIAALAAVAADRACGCLDLDRVRMPINEP